MIGSRAWCALMRRNFIYRKRNWFGSLMEILMPALMVGVLVVIKGSVQKNKRFATTRLPAKFPDNNDAFIPLSFSDYLITMQEPRTCYMVDDTDDDAEFDEFGITGIPPKNYNWQVPFVKCDASSCKTEGEDAAQKYCEYNILALAPSTEDDIGGDQRAKDFEKYILSRYPFLNTTASESKNTALPFSYPLVQIFKSNAAIEEYVRENNYGTPNNPKIAMGVIFHGNSTTKYDYTLRLNSTNYYPGQDAQSATSTTPDPSRLFASFTHDDTACSAPTGQVVPSLGPDTNSCTHQYLYNGVLVIQRLVNDFVLDHSGAKAEGNFVAEHGVAYVPFPSLSFVRDAFYAKIAPYAPLLVTLGLLYPVASIVRTIVLEKELGQKELMKMMSVTESDIQWSWFISYFIFHLLTISCTTAATAKLFSKSTIGFLWIFWTLSFLAIFCFCMTLTALTSQSTRATLIGLLTFFVGYFLTLSVKHDKGDIRLINLVSLHPVGAFTYGLQEIGNLEAKSLGLNGSTFDKTENVSLYTFKSCLASLIDDIILWGFLSWYLNRLLSGEQLPWYFPITPSYWFTQSKLPLQSRNRQETVDSDPSIPVEPVTDLLKAQRREGKNIEIRSLSKRFGDKSAVDCLNLSIYNGQITGLLGHNGAGKTTTIGMLTGSITPTDGYATISGKDIKTQMNEIRQDIGVCLQHDCLFPMLTVKEHVQFFSQIKGVYGRISKEEADEKVDASINDVGLGEKSNTLSKYLSGGMKRKLSIAVAFCGDSKTVLLDEPTSGMDPFSRRFTWNVIRRYRPGRTIILTTHFMDEADLLSDRIAIMAEGRLRCVGSSLFLKKTYGVGYLLTIEKAANGDLQPNSLAKHAGDTAEEVVAPVDASDCISEIVRGAVNEANLLTNVGTELSFQLPLGASPSFKQMFEALDQEVVKGTVATYGLSITTLDEVFLMVARGTMSTSNSTTSSLQGEVDNSNVAISDHCSDSSKMALETHRLFITHMSALLKKRALNFKRDRKAWLCTSVLPCAFVLVGFLIFTYATPNRDLGALKLDLAQYNVNVKGTQQNPITFNANGARYSCQPGECSYQATEIDPTLTTEEPFQLCGMQTRLNRSGWPTCSISQSSAIVDRITSSGASLLADYATNINSSSRNIFDVSQSIEATQYASVHFTHDHSSITSDGLNFSKEVVRLCLDNIANYLPQSECENYAGIGYIIGYNFTALHVTPLFQSIVDAAIARDALSDDGFDITTTIHPLPITRLERSFAKSQDAFSAWFLVVLSFPFIAGTFATFVVTERESKAKHLQTVAGVNPLAYWFSTYLWDTINYQIPLWITVMLMFAFHVSVLTTSSNGVFSGVISVLVLYGPASAGFAYSASFMFKSASMCNVFIIIFCFLIGMGGALAQFLLRLLGIDERYPRPNLVHTANVIQWILRIFPSFCLGDGLLKAIYIEVYQSIKGSPVTVWDGTLLLYDVVFLFWQSLAYLALAVLLDASYSNSGSVSLRQTLAGIFNCSLGVGLPHNGALIDTADDDDVLRESERVKSGTATDDLIVIRELSKVYDNGKVAVNNLSLAIPPGECFGLLGINGAGKTTTMSILTAEFPPTSGDAILAGCSVRNDPRTTRRLIGYCPQFDAHFHNLTGREHVELYASIKGIPAKYVRDAAIAKLDEVGIHEVDRDRLSAGYSGGMKRRLSLACATIGRPQIVFLDECSTGVDPVARREIWQMISDMVKGGGSNSERTSVILTTHSMEECEALCPRIGIMTHGKLRCLGSAQHLKTKFGQGYQVELKVKTVNRDDDDYKSVVAKMSRAFKGVMSDQQMSEDIEEIGSLNAESTFLRLDEARITLSTLSSGDDVLINMLTANDPHGHLVFKDATSAVGVALDELASFATSELRILNLNKYVAEGFPNSVLRERQDNKVRYEMGNEIPISHIFASIEENKEKLVLSDYGVSQTSLEQVFNGHAADAETLGDGY